MVGNNHDRPSANTGEDVDDDVSHASGVKDDTKARAHRMQVQEQMQQLISAGITFVGIAVKGLRECDRITREAIAMLTMVNITRMSTKPDLWKYAQVGARLAWHGPVREVGNVGNRGAGGRRPSLGGGTVDREGSLGPAKGG